MDHIAQVFISLRRDLEGAPGGGEHAGGGPLRPLRRPQELGAEGEQQQGQTGQTVTEGKA